MSKKLSTSLTNQYLQVQYPLMEDFYTIQGEGFYQGRAAYFIRLGGCDVGCVWCDVKDSWDAQRWPMVTVEEIIQRASANPGRLAVITGGEPLMYDLRPLTEALQSAGFETNIETSGAHSISGTWDWVCFSPKKFKAPHSSIYSEANELKVVIFNKRDFAWAETFIEKVPSDCKLFLQPEWSKSKEMLPLVIEYIKQNPKWEISLQIHKFMDIP